MKNNLYQRRRDKYMYDILPILLYFLLSISCKKMIAIPPPASTVTTSQAFSTDELAISAMAGVYHKMINVDGVGFSNSIISIYTGASSDELKFFQNTIPEHTQFVSNNLSATNTIIANAYWSNGFSIIYAANSIIDGLQTSSNIMDSVKNVLLGEAKFVRAFCNFYLCNLFGDIPLVNEINWRNTRTLARAPISQVYQQIIVDLKDAQDLLPSDFSLSRGEKIIPNKWAATALLARVYLYTNDWTGADNQATSIIENSGIFSLNSTLTDVFLTNSSEAIWQLQQSNTIFPYNVTREGNLIIPFNETSQPFIYLSENLLNSFELNDQRKTYWIDSTIYLSVKYYYPKKYKEGPAQRMVNGSYNEYYMVLRLAEQYLIRAEALAKQNKLLEAISDLNMLRQRAGLFDLPQSLTLKQVFDAIEQEREIEFFAEWGHRWFDLKRWNKADSLLANIKGPDWSPTDKLYPIPLGELLINSNFNQNQGY